MSRPLRLAALGAATAVLASLLTVVVGSPPAEAATQNPIIGDGSVYSADPATLVVDDELYIYAGRDEAGPTTNDFIMNEWQSFSTGDPDSGTWEHHPSLMRPETVFDWATSGRAYAGQVVEGADGRFYWYVPVHEAASTSEDQFGIGVAVADDPLGPWTDAVGGPIISQAILGNTIHNIDPTVFVDDDGRVYLYWGSFSQLRAVELEADMVTLTGDVRTISSGVDGFFEAAWLFKRGATYYLAYAANNAGPDSTCTPATYHACIAYSSADSPFGPWTQRGRVLAPVSSTTSHPAITEFQGEWYIAYHTADAVGGNHFRRSVAIDSVEWDDTTVPPTMREVVTTPERGPDLSPRRNVAPWATASASNEPVPTQYWIDALNDETIRPNPLPPDMWGSWSAERPAQQWIQYDWDRPVRIDSASIKFFRDVAPGTGNGVSDPSSWRLQSWKSGAWVDVVNPSGYPTSTTAEHTVTFEPVTTTRLRAVLNASSNGANPPAYSALAVEEWRVLAAETTGYQPVVVSTITGTQPLLPETVLLDDATGGSVRATVHWDPVPADQLAAPGSFTVLGTAEGYAAGRVEATVTVIDGTVTEDTQAPTLDVETIGVDGAGDWFLGDVTLRATALDAADPTPLIEFQRDGGDWTAVAGQRTAVQTITGDGPHSVAIRATDAAGNTSEVWNASFRIDSGVPTVDAAFDAESRAVRASAADPGAPETASGLAGLEVAVDGQDAWEPYTAPVMLDLEAHDVYLRASDTAGNVSAVTAITVQRSADAPLEGDIASFATATASYSSPWTTVDAVNDGSASGASWGTWPMVGDQWVQLSWDREVTLDAASVHFFADAADEANVGVIPPRSWVVETLAADGSWVPVDTTDPYTRDRDVANAVGFTPVATSALRVRMQAWGAAEQGGSVGILEITANAVAPAGEPDTTAPTVTLASSPAEPTGEAGWYREGVSVAVDADDDVDDAPMVELRLGDGAWTPAEEVEAFDPETRVLMLGADGVYVVAARATDAAGNVSEPVALSVDIDTTAPEVEAVTTPEAPATGPVTVRFDATDKGSGVALVEAAVRSGDAGSGGAGQDDAGWSPVSDAGLVLDEPGEHLVRYRATDVAGNVGAERSVAVTVVETPVDPEPGDGARVVLGASSVTAGGSLAVAGSGFGAGEQVTVTLFSDPVRLATFTADGSGAVSGVVAVPVSTPNGVHTVELRGVTTDRAATASLQVTGGGALPGTSVGSPGASAPGAGGGGGGDDLARTGAAPSAALLIAALALLSGVLLVARRRQEAFRG
ncbi:OmpL47-type beta-barrel domain-containing protein [Plantibacter sp. CFBP 8775]|uniref:OmpL47-type beta-barrel domain-containing protein n=1 Tax=Plantibacter sp. CFBP 8775 TaxID=2774038 RepID=UPI00177F1247|nr:family 43 glycosylhydrolase [Plantibacter sp. CFBP 8775]